MSKLTRSALVRARKRAARAPAQVLPLQRPDHRQKLVLLAQETLADVQRGGIKRLATVSMDPAGKYECWFAGGWSRTQLNYAADYLKHLVWGDDDANGVSTE